MDDAHPLTPDEVAAVWAMWFGGALPAECRAGVARNMAVLADHGRIVAAADTAENEAGE